jgi:hypothetical protein
MLNFFSLKRYKKKENITVKNRGMPININVSSMSNSNLKKESYDSKVESKSPGLATGMKYGTADNHLGFEQR